MLSDLGGGVNGYDANLRDKCGVCDDVTGCPYNIHSASDTIGPVGRSQLFLDEG